MIGQRQTIPLRVYQTDNQIMLAAPMPGLEAEDISVTIAGDHIEIRGEDRGPGQDQRDLLVEEWRIGPYYREVSLPQPVNGALANATYGNGVLILSMPKLEKGATQGTRVDFQLQPVGPGRGERIGHTGRDMHPMETQQHLKKHA
ncbi:MAG: Hsp20/alpha crystallin family protein [Deltaproteobacteria bacterium]|nr:Hsp20/alpha crystallin family protein [Deltaproteobacteria bacterium]